MKVVESSNEYLINESEYFFNVNCPPMTPSSILGYIPKLMPLISMGKPSVTKDSINTSIFCNSSECRPSPPSIINVQNYITLAKPKNISPSFPTSIDDKGRMIQFEKHLLDIWGHDIRQMYFKDDL